VPVKTLSCRCGQTLFYDNSWCQSCGRLLGFDPRQGAMISCDQGAEGTLLDGDGQAYQLCANRRDYQVCNGLVAHPAPGGDAERCVSCALNRTVPPVNRPDNLLRWRRLEQAKLRLLTGLYSLGLEVEAQPENGIPALRFDFLADKRTHPDALETFVHTGHHQGVVTINVLEADEMQRVWQKESSSERYRTLLGHFRHEAGHYFYFRLITDPGSFSRIFGDPMQDYGQALQRHYDEGARPGWEQSCISAYASSHPQEDWAESFAHYLHMRDGLETAAARGVITLPPGNPDFTDLVPAWMNLAVSLNELNHSLGLDDAYPFVLSPTVLEKLGYIHGCVSRAGSAPKV
jgi:hypothetical protein